MKSILLLSRQRIYFKAIFYIYFFSSIDASNVTTLTRLEKYALSSLPPIGKIAKGFVISEPPFINVSRVDLHINFDHVQFELHTEEANNAVNHLYIYSSVGMSWHDPRVCSFQTEPFWYHHGPYKGPYSKASAKEPFCVTLQDAWYPSVQFGYQESQGSEGNYYIQSTEKGVITNMQRFEWNWHMVRCYPKKKLVAGKRQIFCMGFLFGSFPFNLWCNYAKASADTCFKGLTNRTLFEGSQWLVRNLTMHKWEHLDWELNYGSEYWIVLRLEHAINQTSRFRLIYQPEVWLGFAPALVQLILPVMSAQRFLVNKVQSCLIILQMVTVEWEHYWLNTAEATLVHWQIMVFTVNILLGVWFVALQKSVDSLFPDMTNSVTRTSQIAIVAPDVTLSNLIRRSDRAAFVLRSLENKVLRPLSLLLVLPGFVPDTQFDPKSRKGFAFLRLISIRCLVVLDRLICIAVLIVLSVYTSRFPVESR